MRQQIEKRQALLFLRDLRKDLFELIDKDHGAFLAAVLQGDLAPLCQDRRISETLGTDVFSRAEVPCQARRYPSQFDDRVTTRFHSLDQPAFAVQRLDSSTL